MSDEAASNGWQLHKADVLRRLDRHTAQLISLETQVGAIREGMGEMRGKQIVWAAIVAIIVAAGASVVMGLVSTPESRESKELNDNVEALIEQLRDDGLEARKAGDAR